MWPVDFSLHSSRINFWFRTFEQKDPFLNTKSLSLKKGTNKKLSLDWAIVPALPKPDSEMEGQFMRMGKRANKLLIMGFSGKSILFVLETALPSIPFLEAFSLALSKKGPI
jgi:hypothetical protein